jgi:hypothetical protein
MSLLYEKFSITLVALGLPVGVGVGVPTVVAVGVGEGDIADVRLVVFDGVVVTAEIGGAALVGFGKVFETSLHVIVFLEQLGTRYSPLTSPQQVETWKPDKYASSCVSSFMADIVTKLLAFQ